MSIFVEHSKAFKPYVVWACTEWDARSAGWLISSQLTCSSQIYHIYQIWKRQYWKSKAWVKQNDGDLSIICLRQGESICLELLVPWNKWSRTVMDRLNRINSRWGGYYYCLGTYQPGLFTCLCAYPWHWQSFGPLNAQNWNYLFSVQI